MPYIDIHTHIGPCFVGAEPLTPEALLSKMEECDIEMAVLLPLESPESADLYATTWDAIAAHKQYPDRLIPFCSLDPRSGAALKEEKLRKVLTAYRDEGCVGFGEHKPGVPFDHPGSMNIYAQCNEFDWPLLYHQGGSINADDAEMTTLETLLGQFPNVSFIGHACWWNRISADPEMSRGYPASEVVPGGRIDELFAAYPNAWGDLSAHSGHNALSRDIDFARGFVERNKHHLLFGTDYLMPGQETPIVEFLRDFGMSNEAFAAISQGNARRLLNL